MTPRKPTRTTFELKVKAELDTLQINVGEDYKDFARRLYEKSLAMRCAEAGREVGVPWNRLALKQKGGWFTSAKRRTNGSLKHE